MKKIFTLFLLLATSINAFAQLVEPFAIGSNVATTDAAIKKSIGLTLSAASFEGLQPNIPILKDLKGINLSTAKVALPLADGNFEQFYIARINIMSPQTALLYPSIKTYDLKSLDGTITGRLTYGPLGFNAMLLTSSGRQYIVPVSTIDNVHHVVYDLKDYDATLNNGALCGVEDAMISAAEVNKTKSNYKTTSSLGDCQLRTYRMAIAATGEFTAVYGGNQTNAVNSITTTVANISLIYQRDAAITFTLVTNNNVIFTNAGSDPYGTVAFPSGTTLNENQSTLDAAVGIGSAAYDLGFVFNAGWNGGLAATPGICNAANKGRGAGGLSGTPSGSVMENLVAHEAGHMFSALHTMSSGTGAGCASNLTLATAYEPGGGSSIMAYAGSVCAGQSYQSNTDGYFHANSVNAIVTYAVSQTGCGTTSSISNTAPVSSNTTATYNIPKSTPFALTSTATDADASDVLSYQFDQYDLAGSAMAAPPASTATSGPVFRSYPPSTSNQRLFPPLANILANTTPMWEVLPSVARSLNFKVIARDNKTGGGCRAVEDIVVNVDGISGPFAITAQNTASSFTANGSNTMTVTWDVANTTAAPINAANVNILFSKDNGVTFPYTLVANTPNDGTQTFIVPNISTGAGRIKIVPTNNIFFDINNANISITSTCLANGSNFTPATNVTATEGNAALNLGLSAAFGAPLTITGTISNSDPLAQLTVVNIGGSNCINFSNNFYYETYSFQVNVTGTYTFAASGGTPFGTIYNLYSTAYTPASPCTNFITSNGVYNGSATSINSSCSATLTAGVVYVIAVGTFSNSLPTLPFSYTINVTPPGGGAIYSGMPPPGAGFSYTFAVVNAAGNIVGYSATGDLTSVTTYPAGLYSVYGISYANAVNLNTYIGAAFTTLQADMLNSVICANQSSNAITVTINPYIWTGASSVNWNTASNWSPATVPGANNTASIPATGVTNEPTVDAVKTLGHLSVANGRTVTINGANTLSVAGNIANNGTITGSSKLILNGATAQSFSGTGLVANLELNNSAGASIASGNKQSITGVLTITNGTLTTNGGLSLKSTAGSDARVAPITSGGISGTVEVERYIPALNKRAWRLLSVPVSSVGAPTIYNSWQEGGANTANYGTQITNAGGAAVVGSWDAGVAGGTSSIRQYVSATNTLSTPSGTNIAITNQPAWFLYVRGDRTVSGPGVSGNTTLRVLGNLNTGNKDFAVPITNFILVGNPYVSPIDFALARANAATTHTLNKFWAFDPKVGANGAYVLLDGGLGFVPSVNTGSYPSATSIVQSGQAFFIQGDGTAGNFRIQEDDKAATYQGVYKTTNGTDPLLFARLKMEQSLVPSTFVTADGIIAAFNNTYNAGVDTEDGIKLWNFGPNLSLLRNGSFLTIEKRPLPIANDTLHVNINTLNVGNYQLELDGANFTNNTLDAYLIDNFLNTSTYINLNTISNFAFSVTSNTQSTGNDRFKIVFQNASPLSAKDINLNAIRDGQNVIINWFNATEKNIHHYEVERSADDGNFISIATQAATMNNNTKAIYSLIDTKPFAKNNYYRIKAINMAGEHFYSYIVRVVADKEDGSVSIAPNPVQGNMAMLQFVNMPIGAYQVTAHNANGQLVHTASLSHAGGSSMYQLAIRQFAKGVYTITITNASADKKITLKMIYQ